VSLHVISSCEMHEDEHFIAACQSAVEELTAWPSSGQNYLQNRARVLAHGLVAAFGSAECLDALPQQLCSGRSVDALASDACEAYASSCANRMPSLDTGSVCQMLKESNHMVNCLRLRQWGAHNNSSCLNDRGCSLEQAVSCREAQEDVWGDARHMRG
jgi:hypothetical protein